MARSDGARTPADAAGETADHHAPTHPRLAAALLMIGIVLFLLVVSVVSVL